MKRVFAKIVIRWMIILTAISVIWAEDFYYMSRDQEIYVTEVRKSIMVEFKTIDGLNNFAHTKIPDLIENVYSQSNHKVAIIELKAEVSENPISVARQIGVELDKVEYAAFGLKTINGLKLWYTRDLVLRMKEGRNVSELDGIIDLGSMQLDTTRKKTIVLTIQDINDVFSTSNAIASSGLVEWCTPSFYGEIMRCSDPSFDEQYYLHNTGQYIDGSFALENIDINAPEAWSITKGSSDIIVGVIDTGVEDHDDLKDENGNSRVLQGWPWPGGAYGNGRPTEDDEDAAHGTAVAGIIAASHNSIGISGIAPNSKILPCNSDTPVSDYGDYQRLADCIAYAADPDGNPNTDDGADIISNSWVAPNECDDIYPSWSSEIDDAVANGRDDAGCVVIFASGNSGLDCVQYPANHESVLSVGAIKKTGPKWDYSSYGPLLDVVAPSGNTNLSSDFNRGDIRTLDLSGDDGVNGTNYWDHFGGTSAACPQAAGVAALILSINPTLSEEEVRQIITSSATDMGAYQRDDIYGWGRLNAYGALVSTPAEIQLSNVDAEGGLAGGTMSLHNLIEGNYSYNRQSANFPANVKIGDPYLARTYDDVGSGLHHISWSTGINDYLLSLDIEEMRGEDLSATYEPKFQCLINANQPGVMIQIHDPWYIENSTAPPEEYVQPDKFVAISDISPSGTCSVFLQQGNADNPLDTDPIYEISAPKYYATTNGIYEFDEWVGSSEVDFGYGMTSTQNRKSRVVFTGNGATITANYDMSTPVNLEQNEPILIERDDILNIPANSNYIFQQGFSIHVEGEFNVNGTEEAPVSITGSGDYSGLDWFNSEYVLISIDNQGLADFPYNIQHLNLANAASGIVISAKYDYAKPRVEVSLSDVTFENINSAIVFVDLKNSDSQLNNVKIVDCNTAITLAGSVLTTLGIDESSISLADCEISGGMEFLVDASDFDGFHSGAVTTFEMINCTVTSTNSNTYVDFHNMELDYFYPTLIHNVFQNINFDLNAPGAHEDHNLIFNSNANWPGGWANSTIFPGSQDEFEEMFVDFDGADFNLNYNNFSDSYLIDQGNPDLNNNQVVDPEEREEDGTVFDIGANYIHQTEITASTTLSSDTEWKGIYNIDGNITVPYGVTLTVFPGTGIRFHKAPSGYYGLNVNGNLKAEGTPNAPIYFTSNEAYKTIKDWNGIRVYSTSNPNTTKFDYCVIEYSYYGLYLNATSPTVSNSLFKANYYGVHARSGCNSTITSNDFWLNTYGVYNYLASPVITNNLIRSSGSRGMYFNGTSAPYLLNNTIDNSSQIGIQMYNNADVQFGSTAGGENGTEGYNEVINSNLFGIYANYNCNPFLGTTGPYNEQIGGSNSIHGNNSYNIYATNSSPILADWNHWNEENLFSDIAGSHISHENEIENPFNPPQLGSSLAKNSEFDGYPDCPDYDFFNPDTSAECALWHWAHDLRITNQLPVALWAWELYVEKYPNAENASTALIKIANFTSQSEYEGLVEYLYSVLNTAEYSDVLRVRALELLIGVHIKSGEFNDASACALSLLDQATCSDQERIALFSLIDLNQFGLGKTTAAAGFLQRMKEEYPNDELTLMAAELMGEEVNWSSVQFENDDEEGSLIMIPEEYALYQAYPNPFNPTTTICYDLPKESMVQLTVYDITGRLVTTLVSQTQVGGSYEALWNGLDANGNSLPSGLYLYRLQAGSYIDNKKMLLLK